MKKSAIETAKHMMSLRDFEGAIKLLQSRAENYEDSFDYYCTLGIACLYSGDAGLASYNFEIARRIKISDTRLLLGQAAIFLRRGDTERAITYYLEVRDRDPQNQLAKNALEFLRSIHGDYETICRYVDSGKIEQFYPPLGPNPRKVAILVIVAILGVFFGIFAVKVVSHIPHKPASIRADLSEFALTSDEKQHPQEKDISENLVHYIMTDVEIKRAYSKAAQCFNEYNDNGAQVEINRILNSNATTSIRQKARLLMSYLSEQTFDSLKENYTVEQVKKEPLLYLDCYVDWSGRIANEEKYEGFEKFTLLVGYEDQKNVQGTVTVELPFVPVPELDGSRPVRILGKICIDGDKVYLQGKSVYQNMKD